MTQEQAVYYLSAMIDGEGCITSQLKPNRQGTGWYQPRTHRVEITNTDLGIVDATIKCLETLGVAHTVTQRRTTRRENHSAAWMIRVLSQEGVIRLAQVLRLQSPVKAKRLADAAEDLKGRRSVKVQ